ncbi:MAG: 2OG-Fe(II) oxygenase [Proteobacteria bacterium]|nr:2OG-Fe(II) oxygenase [Pseudomonadota bacterium]
MNALVREARFRLGDPVPQFSGPTSLRHEVQLQAMAGRYVVLALLGPLGLAQTQPWLEELRILGETLDPEKYLVSCVITGAVDYNVFERLGKLLVFIDGDSKISRLYGAEEFVQDSGQLAYWPQCLILGPNLHILNILPCAANGSLSAAIMQVVSQLPEPSWHAGHSCPAPVLIVPQVFEAELCRYLVAAFDEAKASDSGFMIERGGKTTSEINYGVKRRMDVSLDDPSLCGFIRRNVASRLVPEIDKAFQFHATRMDRYIVARYDAATGGYFRPHRDNVSSGTAHRRFALTVNLNPNDYEGGDLRFPEFSDLSYRSSEGAAIAFSCSLLHEVAPITRGKRFAFLAFLYGEEDARLREENNRHLGANEYRYVAGPDRLFV